MSVFDDLWDSQYRVRAKNKITELEKFVDTYKLQYEDYESSVDELNDAKVLSLKVINNVECFINSLTNKPKELEGVIVTPNYKENSYENYISDVKTQYKKGVNRSVTTGILGLASLAFLPSTIITIPAMYATINKEKKNNKQVIEDCEKKIKQIKLEMEKLQKTAAETVTEQEFLVVFSNNVSLLLSKLKATGITNYLMFSVEQKSDLGALVNSTKTLIRRIDKR